MTTKLCNIVTKEISVVPRGANKKKVYLLKADEGVMEDNKIELEKAQADAAAAKDALEKAAAETAALTEKLAALEKAQTEAAEKAVAEKAALEKAQAEAVEKAAELEKALAVEKEAAAVAECIRKAAEDFKNLPEKAEDLGPMLRTVRKADAATADKLESLLRKVDAIAKGALDVKGAPVVTEKSATAEEEMTKRANAMVVEKKAKSFAEAVDKVLQADKALYNQYQSEKNSRV